ncbi:MAG: SMP-30/gluconolactonase/LRE family protein [Bacteroidota bacterium]
MIKYLALPAYLLLFITTIGNAQNTASVKSDLFDQTQLKLVSSQFSFTEGCSADKDGNVFFTDQPNDKLWKYSVDGKLTIVLDKTGRSNGTYFDKKGNLILCADEKGEFWQLDKKGNTKIIAKDFNGKQLNGPNDLWLDPAGNIYFTDPYYQRDYWTRTKPDQSAQSVYKIPKGTSQIILAADSLNQPNGIVGSPDGKLLYVADAGAGKIYRYDISKKGVLSNKKLLINRGSDGMALDNMGNIYLTGNGITIYNPMGQEIGQIKIPGTSNVCFGGKDKNTLFVTARKSIYTIPMNAKGVE